MIDILIEIYIYISYLSTLISIGILCDQWGAKAERKFSPIYPEYERRRDRLV